MTLLFVHRPAPDGYEPPEWFKWIYLTVVGFVLLVIVLELCARKKK